MQNVSKAYKQEMALPLRKKTYMRVTMGIFDENAHQSAYVHPESLESFSSSPIDGEEATRVYASYEENWNSVDGSIYFMPRDKNIQSQGAVTQALADELPEVRIDFLQAEPVSLKGLSVKFNSRSYPTRLQIETDNGVNSYFNNGDFFQTEDTFNEITFLIIRALEMSRGNTRMRITSVQFGIGISLNDNQIISADYKGHVSAITADMPTIDFSVTVENMNRYYNVDNNDSVINYMQTEQEMQVYWGQGLEDDSIEWHRGATLKLKTWKADDTKATFTSTDRIEYLSAEYDQGEYSLEGVTAFDLAERVFKFAGMSSDEYWIDPYLKNIIIHNPMPTGSCKVCLQLIANASRSILMQNAMGVVMIKSSFIPEVTSEANAEMPYSDAAGLLTNENSHEYASYEEKFTKVNASQYFIPRNTDGLIKCGFVSAGTSNKKGLFAENPIVTLNMESAATFFNMSLVFGSVTPEKMIVRSFNNGVITNTFEYEPQSKVSVIAHTFADVDKIQLEFTEAKANNRIHLLKVAFGDVTDYRLSYNELLGTPMGTKIERVKQMKMTRTIYTPGTELKDLTSEEFDTPLEPTEYEFTFSQAVHGLSANCTVEDEVIDVGLEIVSANSYKCVVKVTDPPAESVHATLTIKGYEYNISLAYEYINFNATGKILPYDNPLISSSEQARAVGEWVGAYYAAENEYDLKFRGDPALEANDLIYLESIYKDELMVRLEDVSTSYSGSINGTIKARRMI